MRESERGCFLEGCERARERVFCVFVFMNRGSESKENERFRSKENAERGSEGAKEREWQGDLCKCVHMNQRV